MTIDRDALPKQAKGGLISPADVPIIKEALYSYLQTNIDLPTAAERQIVNLLHRLNNRI